MPAEKRKIPPPKKLQSGGANFLTQDRRLLFPSSAVNACKDLLPSSGFLTKRSQPHLMRWVIICKEQFSLCLRAKEYTSSLKTQFTETVRKRPNLTLAGDASISKKNTEMELEKKQRTRGFKNLPAACIGPRVDMCVQRYFWSGQLWEGQEKMCPVFCYAIATALITGGLSDGTLRFLLWARWAGRGPEYCSEEVASFARETHDPIPSSEAAKGHYFFLLQDLTKA